MELTQSQKAAAFDTLVEWLESEAKRKRILGEGTDYEYHCGAINANKRALQKALEIASQIATTEQAENMPPDGLDLSQHVGKTAVLWNNQAEAIFSSTERDKGKYPFIIDGCRYTQNGFYSSCEAPTELNVKTILP